MTSCASPNKRTTSRWSFNPWRPDLRHALNRFECCERGIEHALTQRSSALLDVVARSLDQVCFRLGTQARALHFLLFKASERNSAVTRGVSGRAGPDSSPCCINARKRCFT